MTRPDPQPPIFSAAKRLRARAPLVGILLVSLLLLGCGQAAERAASGDAGRDTTTTSRPSRSNAGGSDASASSAAGGTGQMTTPSSQATTSVVVNIGDAEDSEELEPSMSKMQDPGAESDDAGLPVDRSGGGVAGDEDDATGVSPDDEVEGSGPVGSGQAGSGQSGPGQSGSGVFNPPGESEPEPPGDGSPRFEDVPESVDPPPARTVPPRGSPEDLIGVTWYVYAATGPDGHRVAPPWPVTVMFDQTGQLQMHFGCNSGSGTWLAEGRNLRIGQIMSTMMACFNVGDFMPFRASERVLYSVHSDGSFAVLIADDDVSSVELTAEAMGTVK